MAHFDIASIRCAKCGKIVDSASIVPFKGNANEAYVEVSCHGETVELHIGGLTPLDPHAKLIEVTAFAEDGK